jgi:hypothetical protein
VFWAVQVALLGPLVRTSGLPLAVSCLCFFGVGTLGTIGAAAAGTTPSAIPAATASAAVLRSNLVIGVKSSSLLNGPPQRH